MKLRILLVLSLAACAKPDADADSKAPAPAAAAAASAPTADLTRVDRSRQKGSESAKVWFIIASDFQCPYCRAFEDETWPRIDKEYVQTGKIRVAFMNHPMSFHARAIPAAEAAMCAGAQDKFWPMHDSLFVNQEKWVRHAEPAALYANYARGVGVDMDLWQACVQSGATRAMIDADNARTSQVGVTGTPGFIIGDGLAVVGAAPYAQFKRAIDSVLARAR